MASIGECDIHPILFDHKQQLSSFSSSSLNQSDYLSFTIGKSVLSLFLSKNDQITDIKSSHLTFVRYILCLRSETLSLLFIFFFSINFFRHSFNNSYKRIVNKKKFKNDLFKSCKCSTHICNNLYSNIYTVKHTTFYKIKNILLLILICIKLCQLFISGFYFHKNLSFCRKVSFLYFFKQFSYSFSFQIIQIIALICIVYSTSIASSIKRQTFECLATLKYFFKTKLNKNRFIISLFWTLCLMNNIITISLSLVSFNMTTSSSSSSNLSTSRMNIFELCNFCRWQTSPFVGRSIYSLNSINKQQSCNISSSSRMTNSFNETNQYFYVDYFNVIYFLLYLPLFLLSFKAEYYFYDSSNKQECTNPENNASILSRLVYGWFSRTIYKGYFKPLQLGDVFPINIWLKVENLWKKYSDLRNDSLKAHYLSILLKQFGWKFLKISLFQMLPITLQFLQPFWIKCIIEFVNDPDAPVWKGIVYLCGMIFSTIIFSISNNFAEYQTLKLALKMKSCITAEIYNRFLLCQQWHEARQKFTSAQLINLVSIDTSRIFDFLRSFNLFWTSPIRIFVSIYMLWNLLGLSSLGCVAVLIFLLPFNAYVGSRLKAIQADYLRSKDNRVKMFSETLSSIKAIKLYAWENVFIKKIHFWRNKEMANLQSQIYYATAVTFAFNSTTFLISLITFGLFVVLNPDQNLDAKKIFVSISIFDIIRRPFANFPTLITTTMMFLVSSKRIMEFFKQTQNIIPFSSISPSASFSSTSSSSSSPSASSSTAALSAPLTLSKSSLMLKEQRTNNRHKTNKIHSDETMIELKNCTFRWNNTFQLQSFNLHCERAKLIAIVGEIGSGKTSLLLALLGQMKLQNFSSSRAIFRVNGSIAYVSQNPWLHTGTIRENILFGRPYIAEFYQRVWKACALHQDDFAKGDLTLVDSQVNSLSGGQRQRISLARAAYSNADIYLLDDPLSALDSNVSRHVFTHVLGRHGLLNDKARLLVTHNMTFMPQVDHIVFIKKGIIETQGHYRELIERLDDETDSINNPFIEFLAGLFTASSETEYDPPEIIVEPEDFEMVKEMSNKLESHLNRMNSVRKKISCRNPKNSEPHLLKFSMIESPKMIRKNSSPLDESLDLKMNENMQKQHKINDKSGSISLSDYLNYFKMLGTFSTIGIMLFYFIGHFMLLCSQIWLSMWSELSDNKASTVNGTSSGNYFYSHKMNNSTFCLVIYTLFGIGQTIFILLSTLLLSIRGIYTANNIHSRMLASVMSAPLWFFDDSMFGQIINRFTKDIETSEFNLISSIRSLFIQAFRTLFSFIMISYGTQSFWITLTFIPVLLIYLGIYRYYIKTSRQLIRLEANIRTKLYGNLSEVHSGLAIIKSFNVEQMFMKKNFNIIDEQTSAFHMIIVAMRWLSLRLELLSNFVVLIAVAFCILMRENITPGMAGLCVTSALSLTTTFNSLIRASSDLETNIVSIERLFQFLRIPQEFSYSFGDLNKKFSLLDHFQMISSTSKNWLTNGNVLINDFSASHKPEHSPILKDIQINIQHGWKVVIVGRTGAGKSSLALSFFRLTEFLNGTISISNQDISKLDLHELRSSLAIIPQDSLLFSGTLRENLDPESVYSDEQLHSVLKMVKFDKKWSTLDEQFEETIFRSISAGQKQLLCLARILLRKPKILILDEATAAIDPGTEEFVQEVIHREFTDCTVLTIAHRLNTVMKYPVDKVLVLDQSRVAEFDSPEVLLSNPDSLFSGLMFKSS